MFLVKSRRFYFLLISTLWLHRLYLSLGQPPLVLQSRGATCFLIYRAPSRNIIVQIATLLCSTAALSNANLSGPSKQNFGYTKVESVTDYDRIHNFAVQKSRHTQNQLYSSENCLFATLLTSCECKRSRVRQCTAKSYEGSERDKSMVPLSSHLNYT